MSKEEILKLEERLNEADSSEEIDTRHILEELLAQDAKIVGPEGGLYDKAFVLKAHGPQRVPFESVTVVEMNVQCFKDTAIVHSLNTYRTKENSFTLRFFRVWANVADKWQVVGGSTTIVSSIRNRG